MAIQVFASILASDWDIAHAPPNIAKNAVAVAMSVSLTADTMGFFSVSTLLAAYRFFLIRSSKRA